MAARPFDLVLYGATGFVGRLAASYLAQRRTRRKLRWAIAGRDAAKLATLREQLASRASVHLPEIVVADSGDVAGVEAMAASTRVLISTAGPYALYGDAVVDACVHEKTHYADITGETTWVRRVIDRHHVLGRHCGRRFGGSAQVFLHQGTPRLPGAPRGAGNGALCAARRDARLTVFAARPRLLP